MQPNNLPSDTRLPGLPNTTITDFWTWAYSDVMSNTVRPHIAEFLVGHALGVLDKPRLEWDAVDLRYNNKKIEVKSAAYIQTWQQDKLSTIRFDIAKKKWWDAVTIAYSDIPERAADIYVFCLLDEKDKKKANPLDVSQWKFWVLSTGEIEERWGIRRVLGWLDWRE